MHLFLRQLLALACLFVMAPVYACQVTDDLGHAVHLIKPAKRIVSLAPDLTEIVFALGASDQLVGVIKGSDYPPQAKSIKQVGSYAGINIELIVALHPDIILTWGHNFAKQVAVLQELGFKVYHANSKKVRDVATSINHIGCLVGAHKKAHALSKEYLAQLAKLRREAQGKPRKRVFFLLNGAQLMTVNRSTWIGQAIELCSGQNIFADAPMAAPEVDLEAVIAANPQVIIAAATADGWKQHWQQYKQIDAVKHHHLISINPDIIDRAGPRLRQGVQEICSSI